MEGLALLGIIVVFSLKMLILLLAVAMYVWAVRNEGKGVALAKWTGLVVGVITLLTIVIGAGYIGYFAWKLNQAQNMMMQAQPHMVTMPVQAAH